MADQREAKTRSNRPDPRVDVSEETTTPCDVPDFRGPRPPSPQHSYEVDETTQPVDVTALLAEAPSFDIADEETREFDPAELLAPLSFEIEDEETRAFDSAELLQSEAMSRSEPQIPAARRGTPRGLGRQPRALEEVEPQHENERSTQPPPGPEYAAHVMGSAEGAALRHAVPIVQDDFEEAPSTRPFPGLPREEPRTLSADGPPRAPARSDPSARAARPSRSDQPVRAASPSRSDQPVRAASPSRSDQPVRAASSSRSDPRADSYPRASAAPLSVEPRTMRGPAGSDRVAAPEPSRPDSVDTRLRRVEERFAQGDYGTALLLAEGVLEEAPDRATAQQYVESCREMLRQMYLARIGDGAKVPSIAMNPAELKWLPLDHRAGFLLSRIDGVSSIDEILDVSGMPMLEALRIMYEFLLEGVIRLR